MPIKKGTKLNVDPATVEARGRLGAALRDGDEDAAAEAARDLARARQAHRERQAKAILVAAGYTVEDGAA